MQGLLIGTVTENHSDDYPGMVKVSFSSYGSENNTAAWMPVAAGYAGKGYGIYFLPEKDEQVVVGFIGGDVHCGIVLGSLWNKSSTHPKKAVTKENDTRIIQTKGGHTVRFQDGDEASLQIQSPGGHKLEISDKAKTVTLSTADGKQKLVLNQDKASVTLDSNDALTIKAAKITLDGKLTLQGESVTITADNALTLKGKQTKIEGQTMKLEGQKNELKGAAVTVQSSGILTLKGSMTKIN